MPETPTPTPTRDRPVSRNLFVEADPDLDLLAQSTAGESARSDRGRRRGRGLVVLVERYRAPHSARAHDAERFTRLNGNAARWRAAACHSIRQADAAAWSRLDRLIIVCGHYEGVDERLGALYPVDEVSLGEFVLTGGEIAALAFLDATVRLVDGAIRPESVAAESWGNAGPDHPAYSRPPRFRGVDVPAVLLSGDHAKIAAWRRAESRRRAAARAADGKAKPSEQPDR